MKKFRILVPIFMMVILLGVGVTPALADPGEGIVTINKLKHIVRDPLFSTGVDADAKGWVTFACQSVEGFQFSVAVGNLDPNEDYAVDVHLISLGQYLPNYGTISTNGKGEGELDDQLIPLDPGGFYAVIIVKNSQGVPVLDGYADGNGGVVFESWK